MIQKYSPQQPSNELKKKNYADITMVKDHQNQGKQLIYVAAIGLYHVSSTAVKIGWSFLRYQDSDTKSFEDFYPFEANENSNWASLVGRSSNVQK